MKRNIDLMALL